MVLPVHIILAMWLLFAFYLLFIGGGFTRRGVDIPFPPCASVRCSVQCQEVPIVSSPRSSHTTEYSSDNVMCVDNSLVGQQGPYLLRGCPTPFFHTTQNTSGVCSTNGGNSTNGNAIDLLITPNRLVTGLHTFDCYGFNVSSSAIVVNEETPYSDVLVYINGHQQVLRTSTNFTLDVGDNFAVVYRLVYKAVGNVTKQIGVSEPRFTCFIHFACNEQTRRDSGLINSCRECSLRSPVELTDNGRILIFTVDDVEQTRIIINVNQPPLPSPPVNDPTALVSSDQRSESISFINPTITKAITMSPSIDQTITPSSMSQAIPASSSTNTGSKNSSVVLGIVGGVIAAVVLVVITVIVIYFYVCKKRSFVLKKRSQRHAEEANINRVFSSPCSHCNELDQKIKAKGYTICKLSKERLTEANRTSLNEGVPLITCSRPECQALSQILDNSSIPDSWHVAELHQTDSGHPLQCSRVKMIYYTDWNNDKPVGKVLEWLEGESSNRNSIISEDGQQFTFGRTDRKLLQNIHEKVDCIEDKVVENNTKLEALQIDHRR